MSSRTALADSGWLGWEVALIGSLTLLAGMMAGVLWNPSRSRIAAIRQRLQQSVAPDAPQQPRGSEDHLAAIERMLGVLVSRLEEQSRELAKKSQNLESLLDAIDDPVIVTDSDDKVLLCNAAADRQFAGSAARLLGRGIRDFVTSEGVLNVHGAARRGAPQRGQARVMTIAGPRVFGVSAAPLPAAWGEGVFGVVLSLSDITDLAQAGAMRTEFVANASHELRTPVAAIRAAVETIEDGGKDDPALLTRLLGMIAAHSRRLEDMTRDLMDLSRLEAGEIGADGGSPPRMELVDWEELERTLRETFEAALAAKRLELAIEIDDLAREAKTDARLVLLILRNLVDNATKYAFEGTTIRVSVRPAEEAQHAGGANAPRDTHMLRLEVRDKGTGIPLEHQERVFERFYQVDAARTGTSGSSGSGKPRRGTGLGLAIVKHAAKALGGTVGLESVWGKGTTVWAEVDSKR